MSTGTRWHLPAFIDHGLPGRIDHGPMVTACGKRGPIRRREDIGVLPVQLAAPFVAQEEASLVCEKCGVAWDEAEQAGALRVMWVTNQRRQWAAGGAPVFLVNPFRRPESVHASNGMVISVGSPRFYECDTVMCIVRKPAPFGRRTTRAGRELEQNP